MKGSVRAFSERCHRHELEQLLLDVDQKVCNPGVAKSGFVTITEDVRPTYRDAPVKYSVSFSIEEKF